MRIRIRIRIRIRSGTTPAPLARATGDRARVQPWIMKLRLASRVMRSATVIAASLPERAQQKAVEVQTLRRAI